MRNFLGNDRFDNYRSMTAKYSGQCNVGETCKAKINRGAHIGYNAKLRKIACPDCWRKWCSENAEADAYEARHYQYADSHHDLQYAEF